VQLASNAASNAGMDDSQHQAPATKAAHAAPRREDC
jgi:hypothetical protein